MKKDQRTEEHEKEVENWTTVPPDGGWGWFVALGSFQVTLLAPMMMQVFSILYSSLLRNDHASSATVAWIFNLMMSVWNLALFLSPSLGTTFGWRKLAFTGGLFLGISTIGTAFASSSSVLFIAMPIYGIGASLSLCAALILPAQYFEKRRGRVNGIVTFGLSSGQFVTPLVVRQLQETYSDKAAIAIVGALLLNVCVSALLFQSVERHQKKIPTRQLCDNRSCIIEERETSENVPDVVESSVQQELQVYNVDLKAIPDTKKDEKNEQPTQFLDGQPRSNITAMDDDKNESKFSAANANYNEFADGDRKKSSSLQTVMCIMKSVRKNITLFRSMRVSFLAIAFSVNATLYANFLMLIPFVVLSKGYDMETASYCLTILGVCNAAVRLIVSPITDLISLSCRYYYLLGSILIAGALFAFALVEAKPLLLVTAGIFGMGAGCCICVAGLLVIEVLGLEMLPATIGLQGITSTVTSLTLGPLLGILRDLTKNYSLCLMVLSSLNIIPIVSLLLMPFAAKFDKTKNASRETVKG